jgi:predicted ATPase
MAVQYNHKKIVLTGGPGVGKTSILQCLQTLKYDVRDEVFTQLFKQAQAAGQFNDEFLHSKDLIHQLVLAQKELEAKPPQGNLLFLDRSRVDILVYAKNMGIAPSDDDLKWLEQSEYDLIFVIQPLPEKYYDQNSVRRQNQKESLEHHSRITLHYHDVLKNQNSKSPLIEVPFFEGLFEESVSKRTQFILKNIESWSKK